MKINKLNKIKTNNYGFGHMEIILVVLVVAIIGVVGFTVFNNHKTSSSLKATASVPGYSRLGLHSGITVSACKTYTNIWGGIYSVKVLFTKAASTPAYWYDVYDVNGITGAGSQRTTSNAYYAGTVAAVTINMSVVNKDVIYIYAPNSNNAMAQYIINLETGSYANIKVINNITTC